MNDRLSSVIGKRVQIPGHFPEPVILEAVRPIGSGFECRVRLLDGTPEETILSRDEAITLLGQRIDSAAKIIPADAEKLRLLVESARIRLAYTCVEGVGDTVDDVIGPMVNRPVIVQTVRDNKGRYSFRDIEPAE